MSINPSPPTCETSARLVHNSEPGGAESLIKYAGFSRVVAEKIVSKEGTLEEKTLHFSKIVKQIKDGFIDVKELQELRESEIE